MYHHHRLKRHQPQQNWLLEAVPLKAGRPPVQFNLQPRLGDLRCVLLLWLHRLRRLLRGARIRRHRLGRQAQDRTSSHNRRILGFSSSPATRGSTSYLVILLLNLSVHLLCRRHRVWHLLHLCHGPRILGLCSSQHHHRHSLRRGFLVSWIICRLKQLGSHQGVPVHLHR